MVFYPFCHCPLRTGGGGVSLKGQNLLRVTKVICRQSLTIILMIFMSWNFFWFHLCLLSNFVQKTIWFDLNECLWREFWILLILKLKSNTVYHSATSLFYFMCHDSLKLSETNMWKKPNYLIGQLLLILLCDIISQHVIFNKVRWMLIRDPSFKFPLVHELKVCGLFEMFLHEFWLKILCETIADVQQTISC